VVTSLLIGAGFIWLLARGGLPLLPDRAALQKIPTSAVVTFALLTFVSTLLRTYRWVYLLRPIAPLVKPLRLMGIGLVGFGAIFFAPLRTGEIVRPFLLAQDGEVSFMQAAGTLFAERVIDGVMLTLASALAVATATMVSPLPKSLGDLPLPLATVPFAMYSAAAAFSGLFVAMTAFYVARERAGRITRWIVGLVSTRAADWAAGTLERLADGLRFLPSRTNLFSFLGVTALGWLVAFVSQWLFMRGSGLDASFVHACAMVGILGVGVTVPAGPGLFGAYQIASFSALALFFPLEQVRSEGAAMIFVSYVVCLVLSTFQIMIGALLMARTRTALPQRAT
jgi:glycosyltransferase 2 family protein